DKAAERILAELAADAQERLEADGIAGQIHLIKNNLDSAGNSYGCHENYLARRRGDFTRVADVLVPILISRPIHTSTGHVQGTSPPAVRCTASASVPTISGRRPARRPPGPGRSSTPGTSRTRTRTCTGGCT